VLQKIISGGQTGADQGALAGARSANFETGGWAPKGWLTERGTARALLQGYGLEECHKAGYPARTLLNVQNSDATLIIGRIESRGSSLTKKYCDDLRKPCFHAGWERLGGTAILDHLAELTEWLNWPDVRGHDLGVKILNVAGNHESRNPGIYAETMRLINALCREATR